MQVRTRTSQVALEDAMDAIASPRRRQILRLVWYAERSAGEIASVYDVSWPAVSQNLGILKRSGLVVERRAGSRRYYRADRLALRRLGRTAREPWVRGRRRP